MLGELTRNTMALIASLIIITAIVALFGAAAQAWGVELWPAVRGFACVVIQQIFRRRRRAGRKALGFLSRQGRRATSRQRMAGTL